jgi:replication fork clamp-binding protein CrfC
MTRKLDKQDLETLTDMKESYQKIANIIANCTIDEELLQDRLEEIQQEKRFQLQQFKDLRNQEDQIIVQLKDKYGEGQINIEDGTFTATANV